MWGSSQQDFFSSTVFWSSSLVPHLTHELLRQNKGINDELFPHWETTSDLPEACESWSKSTVSKFSFVFLALHQQLVQSQENTQENTDWLSVSFLINAQRHDLDSSGKDVMCAQVHIWDVSACIFNEVFYTNEHNGRHAPKEKPVYLWKT